MAKLEDIDESIDAAFDDMERAKGCGVDADVDELDDEKGYELPDEQASRKTNPKEGNAATVSDVDIKPSAEELEAAITHKDESKMEATRPEAKVKKEPTIKKEKGKASRKPKLAVKSEPADDNSVADADTTAEPKAKPKTPGKRKLPIKTEPDDDDGSDKPSKAARSAPRGSTWTPAERLKLLEYVVATPPEARKWSEAVEGRNTSQAFNQWRDKIYPCLCGAIENAPTRGRSTARNILWTPGERKKLFDHVFKVGLCKWESAVDTRPGNKCYGTWRDTVYPLLKRALAETS